MQAQAIQSRQNEQVKKLRAALSRGERTPDGLLAVETLHLLEEALHSRLVVPQVFFTPEAEEELERLLARFEAQPQMFRLTAPVFDSVSSLPAAQGVAALVRPAEWKPADLFRPVPALVVVLAGIQDPGNAGTMLRTAEAFGATGALLLQGSVHPENSKFVRATAGSVFRLPHLHGLRYGEALEMLRQQQAKLYAAVPRARRTLDDIDVARPLAIAIGSESAGVPEPILAAAEQVSIPSVRKVESLNAAVAGAIALYHLARERNSPRMITNGHAGTKKETADER